MPTATVELCRSAPSYDVVSITAKREYVRVKETGWDSVQEVLPPLPKGLLDFGSLGRIQSVKTVCFELPKDASGTDVTPVLVAADYLRENGWVVEIPKWLTREAE